MPQRRNGASLTGAVGVVRVVVQPDQVEQGPVHPLQVGRGAVRDPALEVAAGNLDHPGGEGAELPLQLCHVELALGQVLDPLEERRARDNARREQHELAPDHQDHLLVVAAPQPLGLDGDLAQQLLQFVGLRFVERPRLDRHRQPLFKCGRRGVGEAAYVAAVDADPVRVQPVADRVDLAAHDAVPPQHPAVVADESGPGVVGDPLELEIGSYGGGGRGSGDAGRGREQAEGGRASEELGPVDTRCGHSFEFSPVRRSGRRTEVHGVMTLVASHSHDPSPMCPCQALAPFAAAGRLFSVMVAGPRGPATYFLGVAMTTTLLRYAVPSQSSQVTRTSRPGTDWSKRRAACLASAFLR